MGSAPYLGGGFGHFYAYAPIKIEYAIDRFAMETKRQLDVLDRRLAESEYLAGDDYTIADMAIWPWYGGAGQGHCCTSAGEFLQVHGIQERQRWADAIAARPAVKRGRMVNRAAGEPASQLHERHDASDFDDQDAGQAARRSRTICCSGAACHGADQKRPLAQCRVSTAAASHTSAAAFGSSGRSCAITVSQLCIGRPA